MSQELMIHEFSTGITSEGDAQKWVSKGFTGRYMNMTMGEIPVAVERTIANHGFAVAEGSSSDQPAIIGRAIPDPDQSEGWAVVAVVTRGEDEYGRSFGFHRYFLCQGKDKLWMLVAWLETYRQLKERYPIFNPYKLREPGKPNRWQEPSPEAAIANVPSRIQEKTPLLIPYQAQLGLSAIHQLAQLKATEKQAQVSWAYDVEALEQPGRFLVIKPISARAEQILKQPVLTPSRLGLVSSSIDDQAIKGAVKGLINSGQVNEDLFETLVTNIGVVEQELKTNAEITSYWNEIFDGQGAANALSQNITSPPMVRLLALRAIVIPEKLSQYLAWLKIERADQKTTVIKDSLSFQSQLQRIGEKWRPGGLLNYKTLEKKIVKGYQNLLLNLYNSSNSTEEIKSISIEPILWLSERGSLWSFCGEAFAEGFIHDFGLVGSSNRSNFVPIKNSDSKVIQEEFHIRGEGWDTFWNNVRQCWPYSSGRGDRPEELGNFFDSLRKLFSLSPPSGYGSRFTHIASLFDALECNVCAAYFYQLSQGSVPASTYEKAAREIRRSSQSSKMRLVRQRTKFEHLFEVILWLSPLVIFSALVLGGVWWVKNDALMQGGRPLGRNKSEQESQLNNGQLNKPQIQQVINELKNTTTLEPKQKSSIMDKAKIKLNFDQTMGVISTIEKEIEKDPSLKPPKSKHPLGVYLAQNFQDQDLQKKLSNAKSLDDPQAIEEWIASIYQYQIKNGFSPDGIIQPGQETYTSLREDWKNFLQNNDKGDSFQLPQPAPSGSSVAPIASPSPTKKS